MEIAFQSNLEEIPMISMEPIPVIASAVSVIASTMAVFSSLYTKNYSQPLSKMALLLLIGDIVFFTPKVIVGFPYPKSELICKVAMGIIEFGGNSSFFWAPAFAHAFYIVVKHGDPEIVKKYMKHYYFFAIYLQIPYSIYCAVADYVRYDPSTQGCVHTHQSGQIDYHYIIFAEIPLVLVVIPCFIWYFLGVIRIKAYIQQIDYRELSSVMLYPGILLVCWLPILISVILRFYGVGVNHQLLLGFQSLANSQGLFDSLVYGSTSQAIKKLAKEGLCCLCANKEKAKPKRRKVQNEYRIKRNTKMFEKPSILLSMQTESTQTKLLSSASYNI